MGVSVLPLTSSYNGLPLVAPNTTRVLSLLVITSLATLVFTVVPVLVELPAIRAPWYVGNDILRLLEPIVAMPLYFLVVLESGVFGHPSVSLRYRVGVALMISAAIYQQGAGFHSASNMYKHPLDDFMEKNPDLVATYPFFNEFRDWIRNIWQHDISHYMYALGGILMSMVIAYVYRNANVVFTGWQRFLWFISVLLYTIIITAIAIEFPKGPLVAYILIGVYGVGTLGTYLLRREGWKLAFKLGRRYVVQMYLAAYVLAAVLVSTWVGYAKGLKNREEAGIKF
ncbi:hypothetical protein DFS34DRAFT_213072 [Phlyctochytrium arcticum]|nr:hypothetical protein DFS34DRAFT_213072 [Phlyctochytrium arcticum]